MYFFYWLRAALAFRDTSMRSVEDNINLCPIISHESCESCVLRECELGVTQTASGGGSSRASSSAAVWDQEPPSHICN